MRAKFGRGPTAVSKKVSFKLISRYPRCMIKSVHVSCNSFCVINDVAGRMRFQISILYLESRAGKLCDILTE